MARKNFDIYTDDGQDQDDTAKTKTQVTHGASSVPGGPVIIDQPSTVTQTPIPVPPAPLPGRLTAVGRLTSQRPRISSPDGVEPQKFSTESTGAPFETLFTEFSFEARPFYNFWVEDEKTNDTDPIGNRRFDDVPRFIKLTWDPAPDLPAPENERRQAKTRNIDHPSAKESERSCWNRGVVFSPVHLQRSSFSQICRSLVNGHLAPGVIESIVEMPDESHIDSSTSVDEETFLTSPDFKGLSIHELIAQTHQTSNGVLGASRVSRSTEKDFIFERRSSDVRVRSTDPDGPSLSIIASTATKENPGQVDGLIQLMSVVSPDGSGPETRKVKFIQPSLGGLFSDEKVGRMSKPEHVETMVALSQVATNLEAMHASTSGEKRKILPLPSFPSPEGLRPLDYVGYVIEKYRRMSSGFFEKIDEIEIPDRETNEYYDSRVLYGEMYRYRIRTILRWTRPISVNTRTSSLARFRSSYLGGEWCHMWAYASLIDMTPPSCPDELCVRPESSRRRVMITFKVPDDSQRDILKMRLLRKTQSDSGLDATGWSVISEFPVQNIAYYDTDVDFFQRNGLRYVYTTQTVSRHDERSTYSEQIAVKLNEEHVVHGEYPAVLVSCAGVRPEHFGSYSVIPMKRLSGELMLSPDGDGKASLSFSGRESIGKTMLADASYRVRVESMDTGETRDFNVVVSYASSRGGPTS